MAETGTEKKEFVPSEGERVSNPPTAEENHDPQFEPIVNLPLQETKTLEEDEDVLFKIRGKLYRWAVECDPAEWKERGTGDVKFLQHKISKRVRLLMRRDKTLKICANHFVEDYMKLTPNCGSDRAWVWSTAADFTEGEVKSEMLAIKFLNSENAGKFKDQFYKSIEINKNLPKDEPENSEYEKNGNSGNNDVETAAEDLKTLKIEESSKTAVNEGSPGSPEKNGTADTNGDSAK